ncbi:tetratricopeptide repeat protein [Fibrella sp. WM1]|uniref:tetratricopeptide repeat protein n=1 Tax=Fibrella musci TaxID=3242485 RepID=UPI003521BC7B
MKSRPAPTLLAEKPTRRAASQPTSPASPVTTLVPPIDWYWLLTVALAITATVYWPSLRNGLTNWDDPDYLTNNPLLDFRKTPLRAYFTTVVSGNWHPLTMLSLSLDHMLGGTDPHQYHRTNLMLHLLNVALTFGLAWLLSGYKRLVAFAVALWFGIHPMHVESVAWIAERKDVLYGSFFLLSLCLYWLFLDRQQWGWLLLSLLAGLLANLAKPAAVILPAVLLLLTWWHHKPTSLSQLARQAWGTIPFVIMSAVFAYITLWAQQSATAINDEFSLWQRTQLAGYGLINYLLKLVWPVGLSALYGRPGAGTSFPTIFLAYTLLSGVAVAGLIWLYRRSALWFFGLAFLGLNLLLTLQLVKAVGSAAYADRYTYMAYTGLFFAIAMTLDRPRATTTRWALLAVAGLFSIACALLSIQRIGVWKNSETLWTDVLKTQPFSATAYSNRALYYEQNDRLEDALADYSKAVEIDARPLFRANRAYLLSKLKRPAEAASDADFLLTQNPDDAVALTIKGTALVGKGQFAEAIGLLQKSYALDSTYLNTLVNLGSAYFMSSQFDKAIPFYQKAIRRDPNNAEHWTNLGAAYLQSRQYADAIKACRQAIALNPNNGPAHLYACYALQKAGQPDEAKREAVLAKQLGQTVDARIWQ